MSTNDYLAWRDSMSWSEYPELRILAEVVMHVDRARIEFRWNDLQWYTTIRWNDLQGYTTHLSKR